MTKRELKQLTYLRSEVVMLEKQIDDVQEKINNYQTHDSVKASSAEFPYTAHCVKVSGVPRLDYSDAWHLREELSVLKSQLEERKKQCDLEYVKLNRYIQSIDDSLIRQILTYRYINNLPWEQVAGNINEHYSGDYVRVILNVFLNRSK